MPIPFPLGENHGHLSFVQSQIFLYRQKISVQNSSILKMKGININLEHATHIPVGQVGRVRERYR